MPSRRAVMSGIGLAGLASSMAVLGRHGRAHAEPLTAPQVLTGVVEVEDMCFATREIRGGDPLVLIHPSLARGAADFDEVAGLIAARGYRVVSFDPRGVGMTRSSAGRLAGVNLHGLAADVRAIIDSLGGGPAHLIGHDFGNRVMRTLATDQPDYAQSITLWGAGSGTPSAQAATILLTVVNNNAPADEFKAAVAEGFFAPGNDPTSWYTGWYTAAGFSQQIASTTTPASEYQDGGRARMMIVQGAQDFIAPQEGSLDLQNRLGSRAQRVVIDGAGHCLVAERPTEVAAATADFLDQFR